MLILCIVFPPFSDHRVSGVKDVKYVGHHVNLSLEVRTTRLVVGSVLLVASLLFNELLTFKEVIAHHRSWKMDPGQPECNRHYILVVMSIIHCFKA